MSHPVRRTLSSQPVRRLRSWLLAFCLVGAHLSPSQAAIDDMPAPADHVLDDTRALEPASHQIISTELTELAKDLQCDLWLTATTYSASGRTLRQQSFAARTRWSGDRPAVLLAYDRADNTFGFSFSPSMWDRYPTASLVSITRHGADRIKDTKLALDERIVLIVQDFAKAMRSLEETRILQSQRFAAGEKGVVLALASLLIGGAIVAAMLGVMSRRRDTTSSEQHYLPDVTVGIRLGAPFGGGLIAEISGSAPVK